MLTPRQRHVGSYHAHLTRHYTEVRMRLDPSLRTEPKVEPKTQAEPEPEIEPEPAPKVQTKLPPSLVAAQVRQAVMAETPITPLSLQRIVQLPTMLQIVEATAAFLRLEPLAIVSESRRKVHVNARHMAMWIALRITGRSFTSIGRILGRDHTSVRHGAIRIQKRLDAGDVRLREQLLEITNSVLDRAQTQYLAACNCPENDTSMTGSAVLPNAVPPSA